MKTVTVHHEDRDEIDPSSASAITESVTSLAYQAPRGDNASEAPSPNPLDQFPGAILGPLAVREPPIRNCGQPYSQEAL